VIELYNVGGGDVGDAGTVKDPKIKPLSLTVDERKDLEEFLKTLTGAPVPAVLNDDTSK
jgi:hypothetical protein